MENNYYDNQRNIRRPNALQRKYKSGKGGPISQQLYDIIMIMSGRYKELSKEQNYALRRRTIRRIRAYTLALISFYCGMSAKGCMQEKDLENDYVVVSQVAQFYEKIPTGKDGVDEFVLTNGTRVEYKKTKRDDNNQKWVKCKTEDGETCYVRAENVKSIESFSDVYEVDTDTYSIDVKVMPTSLSGTVRTIADGAVVKLDPDTLKDGSPPRAAGPESPPPAGRGRRSSLHPPGRQPAPSAPESARRPARHLPENPPGPHPPGNRR